MTELNCIIAHSRHFRYEFQAYVLYLSPYRQTEYDSRNPEPHVVDQHTFHFHRESLRFIKSEEGGEEL